MGKPTVFYDACVLYPAPLRDFLMWLALTELFQAKWTEKIHEEWMRNVLKNRPFFNNNLIKQKKSPSCLRKTISSEERTIAFLQELKRWVTLW